jgi:hypothetical protein
MLRNAFRFLHNASPSRRRTSAAVCVASIAIIATLFMTIAPAVFAQNTTPGATEGLTTVGAAAGLGNADLLTIIGRIINIFLGFLGVILLIIIIYAGFLWMTAGGDAEKIKRAQMWIRNAVIGLLIIVSAFAITQFILRMFTGQGGAGGSGGQGQTINVFPDQAGSLGAGIIESHYPPRDATGVPRNAAIIVTFKRAINIASIIDGYNDAGTPADRSDDTVSEALNSNAVKIYRTGAGPSGALGNTAVRVRFTDDRKTFVFRPVDYLGSPSENVDYTVALMANAIQLENGRPAFTGSYANGYKWSFQTSTVIDTTPPKVLSVFPGQNQIVAKNAIVAMTFNEAIDPTAASGIVRNGRGFTNIRLQYGGGDVDGEYKISNQYRTVEFIPGPPACGVNTCGEEVFCLPGATGVNGTIHSATLDGAGPAAAFLAAGYDGIVDVSGNSLDGNGDGTAAGPDGDNFTWNFTTTDDVNLDPPRIEATTPPADLGDAAGRSNVDPFEPVRVRFDSLIQSSSFNTDNARIATYEPDAMADTFWWTTAMDSLTDQNTPVVSSADIAVKSDAQIFHRAFASSTLYDPSLTSSIRNVYQNCFNPVSSPTCTGSPNCCLNQPSSAACPFK